MWTTSLNLEGARLGLRAADRQDACPKSRKGLGADEMAAAHPLWDCWPGLVATGGVTLRVAKGKSLNRVVP